MKNSRHLVAIAALVGATLCQSFGFAAQTENSSTFQFGPDRPLDTPRMYARYSYATSSSDEFKIYTQNTSNGSDPVLFVKSASSQRWMDDDGATGVCGGSGVCEGTGEMCTTDEDCPSSDASLHISSIGSSGLVLIAVGSFDAASAGTTDVVVEINGNVATNYQVEFGSETIFTPWEAGERFTATGHYESVTVPDACQALGGTWQKSRQECELAGGTSLDPSTVCDDYTATTGADPQLQLHGVYKYGSRCEYTNSAKDSVALAVKDWTKSSQVQEGYEICGYYNCGGYYCFYYCPVFRTADTQVMDEDDFLASNFQQNSSFRGNNVELTVSSDSPTDLELVSAVVLALHPWNDLYDAKQTQNFAARPEKDYLRFYKDGPQASLQDADYDGLSDALESQIGTSSTDVDSDGDGIIDGLEIYGTDQLPLPDMGGDPLQKNIVVEIDHGDIQYFASDPAIPVIYEQSARAFDLIDYHALFLTGDIATRTYGTSTEQSKPLFPPPNSTPIPEEDVISPEDPTSLADFVAYSQYNPDGSFDLISYPFVKRVGIVIMGGNFGAAEDSNPFARYAIVDYNPDGVMGNPTKRASGSSLLHEIGHLLGLGHGGRDGYGPINLPGKPNYHSVMSFPVVPDNQSGETITRFIRTQDTFGLGTVSDPFFFADPTSEIALDECNLNENHGLSGPVSGGVGYYVFEDVCISNDCDNNPTFGDFVTTNLDWDLDEMPSESSVSFNIKYRETDTTPQYGPTCESEDRTAISQGQGKPCDPQQADYEDPCPNGICGCGPAEGDCVRDAANFPEAGTDHHFCVRPGDPLEPHDDVQYLQSLSLDWYAECQNLTDQQAFLGISVTNPSYCPRPTSDGSVTCE